MRHELRRVIRSFFSPVEILLFFLLYSHSSAPILSDCTEVEEAEGREKNTINTFVGVWMERQNK